MNDILVLQTPVRLRMKIHEETVVKHLLVPYEEEEYEDLKDLERRPNRHLGVV